MTDETIQRIDDLLTNYYNEELCQNEKFREMRYLLLDARDLLKELTYENDPDGEGLMFLHSKINRLKYLDSVSLD